MAGGGGKSLIAVVGMMSEARLLARTGVRVIVGGGQARRLSDDLDAALAEGASSILSFGLCGALDPALRVGDLVVASAVLAGGESITADEAWSTRLADLIPGARRGMIAGADLMVPDPTSKSALFRASGAVAVDMESHIAARLASRRAVPFAALRAVSDAAGRVLPPAAQAGFGSDGRPDIAAVLRDLLRDPAQLPALIRTAREAGHAMTSLSRAATLAGAGLRVSA